MCSTWTDYFKAVNPILWEQLFHMMENMAVWEHAKKTQRLNNGRKAYRVISLALFGDNTVLCYMCKQESSPDKSTKIYIRKELVMMDTKISDFHTSFYIPAIQKLAFHLPHVRILGTNHCGEMRHTAFKQRELFKDFRCRSDYTERLVARFANQIQS